MNKKIFILAIVVILLSGCTQRPESTTTTTILTLPQEEGGNYSGNRLKDVEVASVYEWVTDGIEDRDLEDVIEKFSETETDFIFRGFWRWMPVPESPETVLPSDYPQDYVDKCAQQGYTYQQLKEAVSKIKKDNPDAIFCSAIPAQMITSLAWDPVSGEYLGVEETWAMALDPGKWDIDYPKKKFQCEVAKSRSWIGLLKNCNNYDPGKESFYVPDITNERFQELFLAWAKKQIDCGADAIWIDLLFSQAGMLKVVTNDPDHPAVKESFESASKMIEDIQDYSISKGKYVYVGTWPSSTPYPYPQPKPDFVTLTPSSQEIYSMKLDEGKIDADVRKIRKNFGDIPIFAFIDWGNSNSPLAFFSQKLSSEQQREFLVIADKAYQEKGIIFTYPLHGGGMGGNAKKLSFGEFRIYDSLSPEFDTYETIKELALNKTIK